jgi:hypothetical protein
MMHSNKAALKIIICRSHAYYCNCNTYLQKPACVKKVLTEKCTMGVQETANGVKKVLWKISNCTKPVSRSFEARVNFAFV